MIRNTLVKAFTVIALPVAAVAVFAGGAAAEAPQAAPVAGVPLQSEDITTNPNAQYPDPVLNGAAAGAAIGSAVGFFTGSGGPILGGLIGALVGATNPDVVPQVLP
ncbi:glycine zipper domain-containing protein [Nocardia wallacei]|uniref:glycine zipper domain-containing protein n=1 Tax=Nocardia wallacei TaxID=480035 RepID=UPI00245817F0|nr:glycine zipper domain-containing protein [Nocardia wallacei]